MRPTDSPAQVADHLDWLQEQLGQMQQKLDVAEAACAHLKPVVANMRGTLKQLEVNHDPA